MTTATDTITATERVRLALHPGQAEVWRSRARFRVVVSGRRWGKTHFDRTTLIHWGLTRGPGRYWYVAPTREDAKDILWADLKAAVHESWLADQSETELSITLYNGAVLRLFSAEKMDALRGRKLRGLILDEYADMDPRIWSEILRPSLADYRAPALFTGTPKSFNHFHALYEQGVSVADDWRDWAAWQFRSIDNPFLDPAEIEAARRETDPRTFRQEWEASFETLAGRVYYAFSRRDQVVSRPFAPTPEGVALSADFNVDPNVAVIGWREGEHAHAWREIVTRHAGGEATRATARAARALLDEQRYTGAVRLYADATGKAAKTTGPADHAVWREYFPGAVWCVPNANPHQRDRIAAVNSRCETMTGARHLTVDPSCVRLMADLEQVVFAGNGDLDKSNPELTHLSDALGYWLVREWPIVSRVTVGTANLPFAW